MSKNNESDIRNKNYTSSSDYQEMLKCINYIIELFPDHPLYLSQRGEIYKELGEEKSANEDFAKALILIKDNEEYYYDSSKIDGLSEKDKTIINDIYSKYKEDFIRYWQEEGYKSYKLGMYDKTLECFELIIKSNPKDIKANFFKGTILLKMEKYQEALECFNGLIKLYPNFAEAYYSVGHTLTTLDKKEEALKYFNEAIKLSPNNLIHISARDNLYQDLASKDYVRIKELTKEKTIDNLSKGAKDYINNMINKHKEIIGNESLSSPSNNLSQKNVNTIASAKTVLTLSNYNIINQKKDCNIREHQEELLLFGENENFDA